MRGQTAGTTAEASSRRIRPRVLFIGKTYAGWRTRLLNLRSSMEADDRLQSQFAEVTGWRDGGLVERLSVIPSGWRGRARAITEARAFARLPRPHAIWCSAPEVLLPYLWAQAGPLRRPLVLEVDWTVEQQESMATEYFGRPPRTGAALALARAREKLVWRSSSAIVAMSHWAAASLVAQGVEPQKVHVIHPGLDLEWWTPGLKPGLTEPLHILFVGGDFGRKGGPELLRAAAALGDRAVLDIVTTAELEPAGAGVRVHRLEPNSPALRELYRRADVLALPTKADCFGHVAVEAMACGTPLIMTDVGGARDIVEPGVTGWLLESVDDLQEALERAVESRGPLREMATAARDRAELLFDGPRNDRVLADLLLSLMSRAPAQTEDLLLARR